MPPIKLNDNGQLAESLGELLKALAECDAKWQRLEVWLDAQPRPETQALKDPQ